MKDVKDFTTYLKVEKNYSNYTIKNYQLDIESFLDDCKENNIDYLKITYQEARSYVCLLYTSCVILPKDFVLEGLTDSKKLSEKKREEFYDYIMEHAISVGIGMMDEKVIDEVNIYEDVYKRQI